MDASTLTRNLQPLAVQRLLIVDARPDARSRLVEATAAGKSKRAECHRAWKSAPRAFNERLGVERVRPRCTRCSTCAARIWWPMRPMATALESRARPGRGALPRG